MVNIAILRYQYTDYTFYVASLLAKILVEVDQGAGIVNVVEVKLFEDQDAIVIGHLLRMYLILSLLDTDMAVDP